MIQPEQVQDRGVNHVDMDFVFHGVKTEIIRLAVNNAEVMPPPAKPNRPCG
jgi:hypothetical protein